MAENDTAGEMHSTIIGQKDDTYLVISSNEHFLADDSAEIIADNYVDLDEWQ